MPELEIVDKRIGWTAPPIIKQLIVTGSGSTLALTNLQSGAIVLLASTSIIVTLPAPQVGVYFDFITTVTSSTNQQINTDAATTFLQGAPNIVVDNSATSKGFAGNGTSHVTFTMNGTTKGGIIGSWARFQCVTTTQWQVSGNLLGSGAPATPFS